MTPTRHPIRFARDAYRSARYPGDLAAELIASRDGGPSKRWMLPGGVSAAAAVLLLALFLSRTPDGRGPGTDSVPSGAVASWQPFGMGHVPLPRFQPPELPVSGAGLRLEIPARVVMYQDLAMQYRELPVPGSIPESLRHTTVPTIPEDLPSRGLDWLHKVWTGDKSA